MHCTDGIVLEKNKSLYRVTDFLHQHFGYAVIKGQVMIVYEEQDGSMILLSETPCGFQKEPFLLSKTKSFQNRQIYLEAPNGEPCVFFSARYKQKNIILYYRKQHPVRIFDFCDSKPFQTLMRATGEIVVLYEKRGVTGYSTLNRDSYSKFISLTTKNPLKLFEWKDTLYLLTQEERYFLYVPEQNKKYALPLVYHQKPYLDWQADALYIRYRFLHKNIIYKLEDEKIVFVREEY